MSYCVNCGVELDNSVKQCPLCNTPVINPRVTELKNMDNSFPQEKGRVEEVSSRDIGVLISVVLVATAITCGLLNLFVLKGFPWAITVIGACFMLWVLFIPVLICRKLPPYIAILLDGLAVGIYLFLITFLTADDRWFWELALYITLFITAILEIFVVCIRKLPVTFLTMALEIFTMTGTICLGLEILIDRYISNKIHLMWSMIVVVVCVILDITFITMLSHKRIRNAVRRRLHF